MLPILGELGAYTGKLCVLVPELEQTVIFLLPVSVDLISAIFFDQIPAEFDIILRKVFPALGGNEYLMLMAGFVYLTETTSEKDRLFRFATFVIFVLDLIPSFFSKAPAMFEYLGYIRKFHLCIRHLLCYVDLAVDK